MQFPLSTGQVARQLGVTEPRLNDLIRKGKLNPPPPISAGRRAWQAEHALQAAMGLGLLNDELRDELEHGDALPTSAEARP